MNRRSSGRAKAKRLELPHPEIQELADLVQAKVGSTRRADVADADVSYSVFPASLTEELAFYDEQGTIYLSQALLDINEQYADLVAFHESREMRHKLHGVEHGDAHAMAWADELMTAKSIFGDSAFATYLCWRLELYPEGKRIDVPRCLSRLSAIMQSDNPEPELIRVVIHEERL